MARVPGPRAATRRDRACGGRAGVHLRLGALHGHHRRGGHAPGPAEGSRSSVISTHVCFAGRGVVSTPALFYKKNHLLAVFNRFLLALFHRDRGSFFRLLRGWEHYRTQSVRFRLRFGHRHCHSLEKSQTPL